jgi:hypothetical protein
MRCWSRNESLAAGLIPYFATIAPFQSNANYLPLLAFGGLGTFQGLTVFGCHWIANKLKISIAV